MHRQTTHRVYPYLLRDRVIDGANQVLVYRYHLRTCGPWIRLPGGDHGLAHPAVLSWRLSTTQDRHFCLEALDEALERYGRPEIFNSDQGSQFTSREWTDRLKTEGIAISMDAQGAWRDNVFIERL